VLGDRRPQRGDLARREPADRARRETAERHRPEGDPPEPEFNTR